MHLKRLASIVAVIVLAAGAAQAQSSLGIGNAEQAIQPDGGIFGSFFAWIGAEQREFYRSMTAALKAMKEDGSAVWLLTGLSFLYGVLHAAGPGHGKVVISSYMLANETELKRGVILSVASAMMQAVTAIVVVGGFFLLLRGSAVSMTDAARYLEIASYALVAGFGLWLLWRKLSRGKAVHQPDHHHHHHHDHDHRHAHTHDHHHEDGIACAECGHAHMPDPKAAGAVDDVRSAIAAILAVGLRPCSGAVVVLSFALLNGLVLGGVLSVFAMAAGTAITVSALATIAVTAKNAALRVSGDGTASQRVLGTIELVGASLLVVLGVVMLGGALSA